jgi:hypothetical protein
MITTCMQSVICLCVLQGIVPSGQKARCMLDAIGHVDPVAPVYHWVIHRCHTCLRENLGDMLYEHVIIAAPKEENFKWIVKRGNELCHGITKLMVTISFISLFLSLYITFTLQNLHHGPTRRKTRKIIFCEQCLQVEVKYAILHTETWRAAIRDHAAYDYAPIILSEVYFIISTNRHA